MGTGILSLMLGQFSVLVPAAHGPAVALWLVDCVVFCVCSVMFVLRAVLFPETIRPLFHHDAQSMFAGAVPMGLATVVNGFVAFGDPLFGTAAFAIAHILWWADALLAVVSGLLIPFLMFTEQHHELDRMSALWLLPIVACEVTAASAAQVAPHTGSGAEAVLVVTGLILWAFSVPAALGVLTILFLRLALHRIPPKELGISGWLALGPLGTGSLSLVLLASAVQPVLVRTPLAPLGPAFSAIGIVGGLMLWGYGAWWWALGIASTLYHARRELPFNMGWWALTFPLGVYTAATYAIAGALHSKPFESIAIGLTILLAVLWSVVSIKTAVGIYDGDLFRAPCLVPTVDESTGMPLASSQ